MLSLLLLAFTNALSDKPYFVEFHYVVPKTEWAANIITTEVIKEEREKNLIKWDYIYLSIYEEELCMQSEDNTKENNSTTTEKSESIMALARFIDRNDLNDIIASYKDSDTCLYYTTVGNDTVFMSDNYSMQFFKHSSERKPLLYKVSGGNVTECTSK